MPNLTFSEVYTRAALGPNGGLQPHDPPSRSPAKPIGLDYPHVAAQPEYAAEAEKLNRFAKQHADAEAKLLDLQDQVRQAAAKRGQNEKDAIAEAESLLAGAAPVDLHLEIEATTKLINALRKAIEQQHFVVRRVNQALSRAAGRRHAEEHKARVKRLMAAVDELHAANQAEQAVRDDLVRLGYIGDTLPSMNLHSVEDPRDPNGGIIPYWYREAKRYSQSATEIAADLRKARLAASLAE